VDIDRPRDRSPTEFLRLRSEILQLLHLAGKASVEQNPLSFYFEFKTANQPAAHHTLIVDYNAADDL
jgi:hypothetical protein